MRPGSLSIERTRSQHERHRNPHTLVPTGTWAVDPRPFEGRLRRQAHGHRHGPRRVHRVRGHPRGRRRPLDGEGTARSRSHRSTPTRLSATSTCARRTSSSGRAIPSSTSRRPRSRPSTRSHTGSPASSRCTASARRSSCAPSARARTSILGQSASRPRDRRQISRGDYGMKFNQALGSGNMLVADKVKLALDISAVKQG